MDPRDLRAFNAYASHEALLIEDKGVGVVLERGCREVLGHPLVDDHDGRADELAGRDRQAGAGHEGPARGPEERLQGMAPE